MTKTAGGCWLVLTMTAVASAAGCSKKSTDEAASSDDGKTGSASNPSTETSKADSPTTEAMATQGSVLAPVSGETAVSGSATAAAVGTATGDPVTLTCAGQQGWTAQEMKHLQTGTISVAAREAVLPSSSWQACEGKPHCERLVLTEQQKLLAVGANGKSLKVVVAETCADNTMVTVGAPEGAAVFALRGEDIAFETAAVGGDRFVLGGFARHRSAQAKEGFVPREYLITGREGEFAKLEPARNKLGAVPAAAASQIVQVAMNDKHCTTLFWKLGVEQCDFDSGPGPEDSVIFGAHLVYRDAATNKGMTWNAKSGSKELLPALDWIVSDGINVAWSQEGKLYTTQPRWDFERMEAEPLVGAAGPKPAAIGCGRLLTKTADGWVLRNMQQGTYWNLDAERFPDELGTSAVMDCDWVVWSNGIRTSLRSPGELSQFAPPNKDPSAKPTSP